MDRKKSARIGIILFVTLLTVYTFMEARFLWNRFQVFGLMFVPFVTIIYLYPLILGAIAALADIALSTVYFLRPKGERKWLYTVFNAVGILLALATVGVTAQEWFGKEFTFLGLLVLEEGVLDERIICVYFLWRALHLAVILGRKALGSLESAIRTNEDRLAIAFAAILVLWLAEWVKRLWLAYTSVSITAIADGSSRLSTLTTIVALSLELLLLLDTWEAIQFFRGRNGGKNRETVFHALICVMAVAHIVLRVLLMMGIRLHVLDTWLLGGKFPLWPYFPYDGRMAVYLIFRVVYSFCSIGKKTNHLEKH